LKVGIRPPVGARGGGALTYGEDLYRAIRAVGAPWDGWAELPADSGARKLVARGERIVRATIERVRVPASRDVGVVSTPRMRALLARLDCGFELSLQPSQPIDGSVPYATVIWDLGHRELSMFPEMTAGWEWGRREAFHQQVIGRASLIFTGGEYLRGRICEWYGVPSSRVAAVGMPAPNWPSSVEPVPDTVLASMGVRSPYLLYPAQFWPHKNHVGALRALAACADEVHAKSLSLVFVGHDYGVSEHVRATARALGIEQRVMMLGFVERATLSTLYRNAVALLFPSFLGPDNLPPLEAMSLGCPVIAARVPGTEEQLGSAAILVDPADVDGMRQAIIECMTDASERRRLVEAGRELVSQRTLHATAAAMVEAIDRLRPMRDCWGTA
jgi:glycosyltransferase involved in cell wall biosynthesis